MKEFKAGDRVRDKFGATGIIHAPTKKGFAWVVMFEYDLEQRRIINHTIPESELELIKEPTMNRLAGMRLKFAAPNNHELSRAIQRRIFKLLGGRYADYSVEGSRQWLYVTDGRFEYDTTDGQSESFKASSHKLSTLDDLYRLPIDTTITFNEDGKSVKLSLESYENIRGLK